MDYKIKLMQFVMKHTHKFYTVIVEGKDVERNNNSKKIIYQGTALYAKKKWLDDIHIPTHTKYKKGDIYVGHTAVSMDVTDGSVIVSCVYLGDNPNIKEGKL